MNKVVHIKQATKQGSIPCLVGGVVDLTYPSSNTRRGRVQSMGEICPTLQASAVPSVLEDWVWEIDGEVYRIRIRKLTPKECWRLQNFGYKDNNQWNDECFEQAEKVCSNTQLYKQCGNSITVSILESLLSNLYEVE